MDWEPGPKYSLYLRRIRDLLSNEKRTVRDVYYALEATGFPSECADHGYDFEYRYVKRAVKKGRRAGYIDPSLIVDESRITANYPDDGYDDATAFLESHSPLWERYNEDPWHDQSTHVEVWLEKQSLASVFRPICRSKNVRLEATRGDWSDSKVFEACDRLTDRLDAGDDVKILYFGDFNPSGLHTPVAIQNTMRHYGIPVREDDEPESWYFDIWPFDDPTGYTNAPGTIEFERIALTLDQIERYDLPENPTPSSTDKDRQLRERFKAHASNGRDANIELNALKEYHRHELEDMVRSSIDAHIDDDAWRATEARIDRRKDALSDAIEFDFEAVEGV